MRNSVCVIIALNVYIALVAAQPQQHYFQQQQPFQQQPSFVHLQQAATLVPHPCEGVFRYPNQTCVTRNVICDTPPCKAIGVAVITTKPGTCPRPQEHNSWVKSDRCFEECKVDGECPCNRKCCGFGCMRRCRRPVEIVKTGNCPNVIGPAAGMVCSEMTDCIGDGECPSYTKCCNTRCGLKCTNSDLPLQVIARKPGKCAYPPKLGIAHLTDACPADSCYFDSQCRGTQRCCGKNPRTCAEPIPDVLVKQGMCPMSWLKRLVYPFICNIRDTCTSDGACPSTEKCCGMCPKRCMNAIQAPTLICPTNISSEACEHRVSCNMDTDCRKGRKCCNTKCGFKCFRGYNRYNYKK